MNLKCLKKHFRAEACFSCLEALMSRFNIYDICVLIDVILNIPMYRCNPQNIWIDIKTFSNELKCVAVPCLRMEGGGWFALPFARLQRVEREWERGRGTVRLQLPSAPSVPGFPPVGSFDGGG